MVIGGPVLFLAGHVLFKRVIWGVISWPRVTAIAAALLILLFLAPHVTALVLNIVVVLVLVAVTVSDRFSLRGAAVVAGPQGRSQGSPDFEQPAPPA
jgi:low temperature requirement protein LtrA